MTPVIAKIRTCLARLVKQSAVGADRGTKNLAKDTRGVAAIEMAFIFPVMITLLIGMVDVSDGMSRSRKVTITANTVGDLVTQEPGTTTKSALNGIFAGALETMAPYDGNTVGLEVYDFRLDPDGSPKLNWTHKSGVRCGSTPGVTAEMKDLMSQGNDLIISRACYKFSYILGGLFASHKTFDMNEEMTLRPRKALQLDCSDCS